MLSLSLAQVRISQLNADKLGTTGGGVASR